MAAAQRIATLERQVASLAKEVQKGADIESVRRIFHIYGYYFDKSLYNKVTSCFADHPDTRVYWMGGVWKTLDGVRRIYMKSFADGLTAGHYGPSYGLLLDHHMMQDVITISEDGKRAKVPGYANLLTQGRHRAFIQCAQHTDAQDEEAKNANRHFTSFWEGALYENEYIKVGDEWKILVLKYRPVWHSRYDVPVSDTPIAFVKFVNEGKYPETPGGPDEIETPGDGTVWLWPDVHVLEYHYTAPDGSELTDDERISRRRPLKIYDSDTSVLDSSRKGKPTENGAKVAA